MNSAGGDSGGAQVCPAWLASPTPPVGAVDNDILRPVRRPHRRSFETPCPPGLGMIAAGDLQSGLSLSPLEAIHREE